MTDYYDKYIKYKNKYIEYKNRINKNEESEEELKLGTLDVLNLYLNVPSNIVSVRDVDDIYRTLSGDDVCSADALELKYNLMKKFISNIADDKISDRDIRNISRIISDINKIPFVPLFNYIQ